MFASIHLGSGVFSFSSIKQLDEEMAKVRHDKKLGLVPSDAPEQVIALNKAGYDLFNREVEGAA